jgi:hypothetical protein
VRFAIIGDAGSGEKGTPAGRICNTAVHQLLQVANKAGTHVRKAEIRQLQVQQLRRGGEREVVRPRLEADAAALAAVAGCMYLLRYGVIDFYIGFLAGVKAFTAAVFLIHTAP